MERMEKLKIGGYKKVITAEIIDTFQRETFDSKTLYVHVRVMDGVKYFSIETRFQVLGFTISANNAFAYLHNATVCTLHELSLVAKGQLMGS